MELNGATEYTSAATRLRANRRAQRLDLACMTQCVHRARAVNDMDEGSDLAVGEKGARILVVYVKQQKPIMFSTVGKHF